MAQQLRFGFRNVQLVKSEENSLGNGSYGAVYKAKCDQLVCAAKILHPILFQTRDPSAYRIVEHFQREIDFLSGLMHPNIIQYLGSRADPETRMPILFMELMDESLTSFLERPADPPPLPLHVQVDIGHDVAQALSHLHHHEVLHRDLSSNNVLLTGSRRAKVTDFGMAKLLGSELRHTPTYCPGTNGYMSPEALADPPAYTSKLDVFSCGVLFVQIITRKWPDPGPRTRTVQVDNDPRFPSGRVHVDVPELERRKEHLNLISPTHPLLEVALDCLKDKEGQRPMAEQLCSRLIALKESAAYRNSLQQTREEMTGQTPPTRDQELEQQLRESESRVEDLTREVQQMTLQNEEQARSTQQQNVLVQQKDEEIQQLQQQIRAQSQQKNQEIQQLQQQIRTRMGENGQLCQQLQSSCRENEQMVAALQQSVEQKDAVIQAKDELLQEKEREIRELQQRVRGREGSGVATGPLKLKWRDGPLAPFATCGHSVAVSGDMVYCADGVSGSKVLMFNSRTGGWTILPECPKKYFSIAVVNGQLTAIGGRQSDKETNTLLSLSQDRPGIFQPSLPQKWFQQLPPMKYCRNGPAVATTNTSLIVAGGCGPDGKKAPVEVLDIQTLRWSTVASLLYPLEQTTATIYGDRLYIGGGFGTDEPTKSVVVCEVKDLLQSQQHSLLSKLGLSSSPPVWKEFAPLPVIRSSLITFQGQLLAVGGSTTGGRTGSTSEVRQYDAATNSWKVISQMKMKRAYSLIAVIPNNRLMVCGGNTPRSSTTDSVEIAALV